MKLGLFLFILMHLSMNGSAAEELPPSIYGILVGWQAPFSTTSKTKLKKITSSAHLHFAKSYQSEHIFYYRYPNVLRDYAKPRASCTEILKIPGVLFCNFNQVLRPNTSVDAPCTTGAEDISPIVSVAQAIQNTCDIVPKFGEVKFAKHKFTDGDAEIDRLSPFWAQEYTGADLLREQILQAKLSYPPNLLGSFDNDWAPEYHATGTTNLISSNSPTALLPDLQLKFAWGNLATDYLDFAAKREKDKNYPMYMNNSMGWGEQEVPFLGWINSLAVYQAIASLSKGKSLLITATGNYGNTKKTESQKIEASKTLNLILVGSADYSGRISSFSQNAPNISLIAPSDVYLSSSDQNGNIKPFGGTSGAAPQVTAALAAFTAISHHQLSRDDALKLLRNTATKSFNSFEVNPEDGAGILNTYKIGQIAFRLLEQCKNIADPNACVSSALDKAETYSFQADPNLIKEREKFPYCLENSSAAAKIFSTCELAEALKKIRAAALLTGDPNLYKNLSCIYHSLAYTKNAEYYDNISFFSTYAKIENPKERIEVLLNKNPFFAEQMKMKDQKNIDLIQAELDNLDWRLRIQAMNALSALDINVQAWLAILSKMSTDPTDNVRASAFANASETLKKLETKNQAFALYKNGLQDSSGLVRAAALSELGFLLIDDEIPEYPCQSDGTRLLANGKRESCDLNAEIRINYVFDANLAALQKSSREQAAAVTNLLRMKQIRRDMMAKEIVALLNNLTNLSMHPDISYLIKILQNIKASAQGRYELQKYLSAHPLSEEQIEIFKKEKALDLFQGL